MRNSNPCFSVLFYIQYTPKRKKENKKKMYYSFISFIPSRSVSIHQNSWIGKENSNEFYYQPNIGFSLRFFKNPDLKNSNKF